MLNPEKNWDPTFQLDVRALMVQLLILLAFPEYPYSFCLDLSAGNEKEVAGVKPFSHSRSSSVVVL
jgi:hypothetical protein